MSHCRTIYIAVDAVALLFCDNLYWALLLLRTLELST